MNGKKDVFETIDEISKLYDKRISAAVNDVLFKQKTSRIVMRLLYENGQMLQSVLTECTHMQKSTVSESLTGLEKAGYIVKFSNDYDLRSVKISITKKGSAAYENLKKVTDDAREELLHGISLKDEATLEYVLDILNAKLNKNTKNKT
ncbi:MAG: MarR family winged helix-turn-helix transcriptional regulator [Eubacteriales bacterium]